MEQSTVSKTRSRLDIVCCSVAIVHEVNIDSSVYPSTNV